MSMYSNVRRNVSSYYASLQAQYSAKYLKEIMIGLALLVGLGGGYVLNRWYVSNREQQAFDALYEVVNSYNQAQYTVIGLDPAKDSEKIAQSWSDALMLVDALYQEHAGSYLAPYFLAYKAQLVLEKDKNVDEAIRIMDDALSGMGKNTEIGSMFYMKRIKMGFDSSDVAIRDQSFEQLQQVAQDKANYGQQEALYTLGLYYFSQGQLAKAQDTLKELVQSAQDTDLIQSPWVKLAQEKLGISA